MLVEGLSRITKRIVMSGTPGREGGPGWAARGPAWHGNEDADVGGGGGGGTGRGGLDRRSDTRRFVVGRRGGAGDPPECAARDPGRSRDRGQEGRSGSHRGAWNRHPDRQRCGQVAGGQR